MMTNKPRQWEIWSAYFAFEDKPNITKLRLVLILDDKEFYPILAAKITKHGPRSNFPGEYKIVKWKQAGLEMPSTVRLTKTIKMTESDFKGKIGKLSSIDIIKIQELIKNCSYL